MIFVEDWMRQGWLTKFVFHIVFESYSGQWGKNEKKNNIFYKVDYNRGNIDRNEGMRHIYNFGLEYPSVNNCEKKHSIKLQKILIAL